MPLRRAAIYCRLSLTTEESVSIARQAQACRRYAEARGLEVVLEAVDDGVSATRKAPDERPGWRQILEVAADLDVVIVWKVDRLARRVLDFLHADRTLQEHGAGLVAVEDPIDMTTAQGRAFATMLAVFGEMEAAAISARATSARAHMVAVGRTVGGRRPWPYESAPAEVGVEWRPIPERADAVRWAAEEMIAGRASLRTICREWERRGLRPSGESPFWQRASVARLLRNPVLVGAMTHRGAIVRNDDSTIRVMPERVILDFATFNALQETLEARSVLRDPIIARVPTILGDLVRCRSCGRRMHQRQNRPRPFFVCSYDHCTARAAVSHSVIEPAAEQALLETAGGWFLADTPLPPRPEADPVEVALIEDALADIELSLAAPDLGDEEGLRLLRSRRDLRLRLATLRDLVATPPRPVLVPYRESTETYAERWAVSDVVERARLMASVFEAIEVAPGARGARRQAEGRFRFLESLDDLSANAQE